MCESYSIYRELKEIPEPYYDGELTKTYANRPAG